MIDTLSLMTGIDIPVKEIPLIIHQPTIKEISFFGEQRFLETIQLLCIDKNTLFQEDKSLLDNISNFQLFMKVINETTMISKQQNIKELLFLLTGGATILTPQSLVIMKKQQEEQITSTIDENNFSAFQDALKTIFCISKDDSAFNPEGDKAREIAAKLKRGRERVAAQQSSNNKSVFSQYLSTITVGIGSMSLKDALDLTLFQLYDLVERYSLYISWDIDIRSRLAGADIKKDPDNWMKEIH